MTTRPPAASTAASPSCAARTCGEGIADLAAKGINITAVFADNNNHIHITRG